MKTKEQNPGHMQVVDEAIPKREASDSGELVSEWGSQAPGGQSSLVVTYPCA